MIEKDVSVLDSICKWRTQLMGLAIIWVAVFHSYLVLPEPWTVLKNTGYAGVDIFLLLSGVGMYHSLNKCSDMGVFYKKRIERILPSYLPFILLWFVVILKDVGLLPIEMVRIVFGNLFMTGWINDVPYQFNWYVQIICWLYLLSPVLHQIIVRCKNRWQELMLLLAGFGVGIPFLYDIEHLMGASRVPIFLLGMLWAHEDQKKKMEEKNKTQIWFARIGVILLAIIGILIFLTYYYRDVNILWLYGLWWYPFILITPGMCYLLSVIMNVLDKFKIFKVFLIPIKYIGLASFEIYLLHIDVVKYVISNVTGIGNIHWIGILVILIVLGILYHYCVTYMMKGLKKWKK